MRVCVYNAECHVDSLSHTLLYLLYCKITEYDINTIFDLKDTGAKVAPSFNLTDPFLFYGSLGSRAPVF